jgi:heme exporter protein C
MLQFLSNRWWKWVSVILLTFAFFSGLLIPLGPGIRSISPDETVSGKVLTVEINGYNTHFSSNKNSLKVYLKSDDVLLCGNIKSVYNEHKFSAEFNIPAAAQQRKDKEFFSVIAENKQDGTFFLRKGFAVKKNINESNVPLVDICIETIIIKNAESIVFPYREILYESIRNLFFHVPMWFSMILLMLFAFVASIRFLSTNNQLYDVIASASSGVGLFYGLLGILTGMQWANFTWGAPWINDPKLNGAAVGMLIYLAYFILRGSLENEQTRARVSAVYNIFSFVIFIVFIFVIPRLSDSLHPGSGGNPGFNTYDLDNTMRPVFYSGVIGFAGIGFWIASLFIRYKLLIEKISHHD